MRAAKVDTVDDRQIVFKYKKQEETQLKGGLMSTQLQMDKMKREGIRIESKVIPELERQIEAAKYDIYSVAQREVVRSLDNTINAR